jgi:Mg/Co/Ni transporter MgtE
MKNEFLDVLTVELRKKSKQHYMFEEIEGDYKDKMITVFQNLYSKKMSELLENFDNETFEQVKEIVNYSKKSGIFDNINLKLFESKDSVQDGIELSESVGDVFTKDFLKDFLYDEM